MDEQAAIPGLDMSSLQLDVATHSAAHQQEPVFLVRDLLWKEVVELLEPVEVDEVRRVLGSSLIDENEVQKPVCNVWC
jgi:hypothetical protein